MDEIEAKLLAEFPDLEVIIHPDPEGLANEKGRQRRTCCSRVVHNRA